MTLANKLIELFDKHAEDFGLSDHDAPGALQRQCDFEDAFNALVCQHKGHYLVPDHCLKPEHDYCVRCGKRREHIEQAQPATPTP